MCIKVGKNELQSVRRLMSMSLIAVVSDVFELDIEEMATSQSLTADLGMTPDQAKQLSAEIGDMFDGVEVHLTPDTTIDELLDVVVEQEFREVANYLD